MDKPTPKFRTSEELTKQLNEMAEKLASDDHYCMPSAGLGKLAIINIIRRHMMERRRKDTDPLINSSLEDTSAQSDTSSSCSTPLSSSTKAADKCLSYNAYFKEGKKISAKIY